jgi:hypothetical protein
MPGLLNICADVLERYLGKEKVFRYIDGDKCRDRDKFFTVLDEWSADSEQPIRMVCLCHELQIVQAQQKEMQRWADIVSRRSSVGKKLADMFVTIPKARANNPKLQDLSSIPADLLRNGNVYNEATDIDRASAERLAEYLLREALDLPPKKPTSKAFTYEKTIINFYAHLYRATSPQRPFIALPKNEKKTLSQNI